MSASHAGRRGVAAGHLHPVRHGGEAVAATGETGEQNIDSGHGLGPVAAAAAVVHHDDPARAGADRRGRRRDDLVGAGATPVLGVVVGQHHQIAARGCLDQCRVLGRGHRVGLGRVWRPHQRGEPAGGGGDRVLRQRQFQPLAPRGQRGQLRVGEGMHTDLMPLGDDAARQVGVLVDSGPDHEERGMGVMAGQNVEDLRGPARVGPIVEGERHCAGVQRSAGGLPGRIDVQHWPALRHRLRRGAHASAGRDASGTTALSPHMVDEAAETQLDEQHQHRQQQQDPVGARLTTIGVIASHDYFVFDGCGGCCDGPRPCLAGPDGDGGTDADAVGAAGNGRGRATLAARGRARRGLWFGRRVRPRAQ